MSKYEWLRGSGSGSGAGGMRRTDVRDRTHERHTINHPDGRVEMIETIRETDVRDRYISAFTDAQYEQGVKAFAELESHAAQHEMPIHSLAAMKAEAVREIEAKIAAMSLPPGNVKLIKSS